MIFGVGAGFHLAGKGRSCQLQERIARNKPVPYAKGGSWPPTMVPHPRTTSYLQGSLCLFWVGLFWRSPTKPITPRPQGSVSGTCRAFT